jgi:hypothetical protein
MSKDPPSLKRSVGKVKWTMGWTAKKSWIDSPELQVILSLLQNVQSGSGGHLTSHSKHNWGTSIGMKLTTHFHPVPRLRTSGTIPPVPQYAFMAFIATASPLTSTRNKHTTLTTRKSQTQNDVIHLQIHLSKLFKNTFTILLLEQWIWLIYAWNPTNLPIIHSIY